VLFSAEAYLPRQDAQCLNEPFPAEQSEPTIPKKVIKNKHFIARSKKSHCPVNGRIGDQICMNFERQNPAFALQKKILQT
jgi:hypothetical protein